MKNQQSTTTTTQTILPIFTTLLDFFTFILPPCSALHISLAQHTAQCSAHHILFTHIFIYCSLSHIKHLFICIHRNGTQLLFAKINTAYCYNSILAMLCSHRRCPRSYYYFQLTMPFHRTNNIGIMNANPSHKMQPKNDFILNKIAISPTILMLLSWRKVSLHCLWIIQN